MTQIFAHRGVATTQRENTLAAFAEAIEAGADGVELDVRRTADGALGVHHDASIAGRGPIAELSVGLLPRHVPLLVEALEACGGLTINVELKNHPTEPGYDPTPSLVQAVHDEVVAAGVASQVLYSSFDRPTCELLVGLGAEVRVGWLLEVGAQVANLAPDAAQDGFCALHPFVLDVTSASVEVAHGLQLAINTWTVNARHDLEAMVTAGVDVIITDDVALALEVRSAAA